MHRWKVRSAGPEAMRTYKAKQNLKQFWVWGFGGLGLRIYLNPKPFFFGVSLCLWFHLALCSAFSGFVSVERTFFTERL